MKFRCPVQHRAHSACVNTSKLCHERMSHINMKYVKDTVNRNAVNGIDPNELEEDFTCEECHLGKKPRLPFPRTTERSSSKPVEVIHADLSGKMPVDSLRGSRYFLLFKDDFTGFRLAYFIKEKSETAECIKTFIQFMEKQTGTAVKAFKSDNGTEFVNKDLASYFEEKGIMHHTSAPYCPESNGRIEREMRTVKDTARAMMQR